MVTKELFTDTLFEMLDEMNWGVIEWDTDEDFKKLLADAWDRAERHDPELYRMRDVESGDSDAG